jgi:hypothetical protein
MWGDDYLPPDPKPPIDTGSPWITALLIIAAIALILTCLPGGGS